MGCNAPVFSPALLIRCRNVSPISSDALDPASRFRSLEVSRWLWRRQQRAVRVAQAGHDRGDGTAGIWRMSANIAPFEITDASGPKTPSKVAAVAESMRYTHAISKTIFAQAKYASTESCRISLRRPAHHSRSRTNDNHYTGDGIQSNATTVSVP
jgi:hypothetical protein